MTLSRAFKRIIFQNHIGQDPPKRNVIINNQIRMLHYKPKNKSSDVPFSISGIYKKARDTVLVLEASVGPVGKAACGMAQASAVAAIVFGTGCGLAQLVTLLNPTLETGKFRGDVGLLPKDFDTAASSRIGLTYFHMVSSLLASSVTALLSFRIFRNKAFLMSLGDRPLVMLGVGVVTPFVLASLVHKLPPTKVERDGILVPFGLKEFGHLLYAGTLGLVAAPLYLVGGTSLYRAAFVTLGICAGLEGVLHVAPKDVFLNWGKPITCANAAVLLSFILTLLLRRDHRAFMPLYRIMMHGGLAVYSAHYLHIGQVINRASKSPAYDPVNASMALTMDLLNVYARMAFLLPPHFQLSQDHHFVLQSGKLIHPTRNGKNMRPDTTKDNAKPENDPNHRHT